MPCRSALAKERKMTREQEVGSCVGCGEETGRTIECNCTQAIFACEGCCEIGATQRLRCATCREWERRRAERESEYACRDFGDDPEPGRDMGGRLPVAAPVGAWGRSSRRHDVDCSASQRCTGCGWKLYECCCAPGTTSDTYRCDCGSQP